MVWSFWFRHRPRAAGLLCAATRVRNGAAIAGRATILGLIAAWLFYGPLVAAGEPGEDTELPAIEQVGPELDRNDADAADDELSLEPPPAPRPPPPTTPELLARLSDPHELNVRELGAVGDGVADDTQPLQWALALAQHPTRGGRVYIPCGNYRVTRTLKLTLVNGLIIYGDGSAKFTAHATQRDRVTCLAWDGEPGGTLMQVVSCGGLRFRDLNFAGKTATEQDANRRAGVLFQANSNRAGTMLNSFRNVGFYHAGVGLRMGTTAGEKCNADLFFGTVVFQKLDAGLQVLGPQGVDYTFNALFAVDMGTILDFRRGGNLLVNSAQVTKCSVFLDIGAGGKMGGTYVCNNVRLESTGGGRTMRHQLLRTNPRGTNCTIRFTGFNDCQWAWDANHTPSREKRLCEIGPGAIATFDNSIFLSPLAQLHGRETHPASLILRECMFFTNINRAVAADSYGYYQFLNCTNGSARPLPDRRKWPEQEPVQIPANEQVTPANTSNSSTEDR